jgi:hypothetical protein
MTLVPVAAVVTTCSGKISVIRNPNYFSNGPSQDIRARAKYGLPVAQHRPEEHAHHRRDNSTLRHIQSLNVPDYYLNPVVIGDGESAQTLTLDFDTGCLSLGLSHLLSSTEAGTSNPS